MEWGVHVAAFGAATGLAEAQINGTASDTVDPEFWFVEDIEFIRVVDKLCGSGNLDDRTLQRLQHRWTAEQQLEIFSLCGTQSSVSYVANVARLPCEDFAARFPMRSVTT